jgi:hypothetical protein
MRAARAALEPLPCEHSHKKSRLAPGACDAATSTSHSDSLELEYASSLIRVIRSRKDVDARHTAQSLAEGRGRAAHRTCARSPVERPVQAAESVLLLSGCDKFTLPARQAAPGTLALPAIAVVHAPVAAQESANSDDGGVLRSAARQRYSSKACRSLADDSYRGSLLGQRLPANRRQEISILSRPRSPPGSPAHGRRCGELAASRLARNVRTLS